MSITAKQAAEDCWHVYEDGVLVGAMGVSGSTVENDNAVALAGVKTIGVSDLPLHHWRT